MHDPLEDLTPIQRVRAILKGARESFADFHREMLKERDFALKLVQYFDDSANELDRRRIKPRSQSPFRNARYKAGQILKSPPFLDVRPVEPTDTEAASLAKKGIEHEVYDGTKRYERIRRNVVWAGLVSRMGCAAVDWVQGVGVFGGEVRFRDVDGTNLMWADCFVDPHDPDCPWLVELCRMPLDQAQRMEGWKNTGELTPDDGEERIGDSASLDRAGGVDFNRHGKAGARPSGVVPMVTVIKLWERFSKKRTSKQEEYRQLDDGERHLACVSCGYKSASQEQAGAEYPDRVPLGCPVCAGDLQRIDAVETLQSRLAYPNGKLTICAPYSGEGAVFYEGPWPQPMRSFPYLVWQPYASPFEPIGTSDVDLNWTMDLVKNAAIRRFYEDIITSRGMMLLPGTGIEDANGEPYQFTDEQGMVCFYNTAQPPPGIQYVAGPQPNNSLPTFINLISNELRGNDGTGEVVSSGQADALKGVAVGAVEAVQESGNVAVDDHVQSFQIEEGLFFSVVHDIQRARWDSQRWVRYFEEDGQIGFAQLRGSDIPAADIVITSRPSLAGFDRNKMNAMQAWEQMSPPMRKLAARYMGLSPSDLRTYEAEMAQFQEQQMQQAAMMGGPMVPPGGPGAPAQGEMTGPPV